MKTTLKINGTTYTLSSGHATYENKHLSDEQRLQLRINEITLLANKKPRKPVVRKPTRVYPKFGAVLSTAAYVRDYYAANGFKDAPGDFFQPLSNTVSVPMGEDTHEVDA
jgi:hypothetical protein